MEPKTIKLMAEYYGITENTMYNILTAMPHDKVEDSIKYVENQIQSGGDQHESTSCLLFGHGHVLCLG